MSWIHARPICPTPYGAKTKKNFSLGTTTDVEEITPNFTFTAPRCPKRLNKTLSYVLIDSPCCSLRVCFHGNVFDTRFLSLFDVCSILGACAAPLFVGLAGAFLCAEMYLYLTLSWFSGTFLSLSFSLLSLYVMFEFALQWYGFSTSVKMSCLYGRSIKSNTHGPSSPRALDHAKDWRCQL